MIITYYTYDLYGIVACIHGMLLCCTFVCVVLYFLSLHSIQHMEVPLMDSREQELFDKLLSPHNRRDFIKRAGALGLSASALTAFLEACGSSSTTTTTGSGTNMAGPIDMQTLITNAKKEGQLQAIGIPPEWADYADILAGYTS